MKKQILIRQLQRGKLSRKTRKSLQRFNIRIPKAIYYSGASKPTAEFYALNVEIRIAAYKREVRPIVVACERFAESIKVAMNYYYTKDRNPLFFPRLPISPKPWNKESEYVVSFTK